MPTISYVSLEEHELLKREVATLRTLLHAYVTSQPEWLPTADALKAAGIRTRETLEKYARSDRPGTSQAGRIAYRKVGTKCLYLKSSCIDYAQRKLGQPIMTT